MIPVGYMAKRVAARPEWLVADVADIYSVGACMSPNFAEFIDYWKHNGYWFFDSPEVIKQLAIEHSIDLDGTTLFYYEVSEKQLTDSRTWEAIAPDSAFPTSVVEPPKKHLQGFDVVTFYTGTTAECSPLSCNSLASEIRVNEHCLLASEQEAIELLESGRFEHSEPGPYRVFAVYTVGSHLP